MKVISEIHCDNVGELLVSIKDAVRDSKEQSMAIYPVNSDGWNVQLLEDILTDGSKVYHLSIRETR